MLDFTIGPERHEQLDWMRAFGQDEVEPLEAARRRYADVLGATAR